jgi:hypothetical protein
MWEQLDESSLHLLIRDTQVLALIHHILESTTLYDIVRYNHHATRQVGQPFTIMI